MTEEEKQPITFPELIDLSRLGNADAELPKLHDVGVLETKVMHFMYPRNMRGSWGKVSGLYTYYGVLNRLFRKTLTPRDGNTSDVTLFQRNLIAAMRPGHHSSVWVISFGKRSRTFLKILRRSAAPYIMYMIKKVTGTRFPNDVKQNH